MDFSKPSVVLQQFFFNGLLGQVEMETKIYKQNGTNLPISIVEKPGIPHPVIPTCSWVEIVGICSIKHVQAIQDVVRCMATHTINNPHQKMCDKKTHKSEQCLVKIL